MQVFKEFCQFNLSAFKKISVLNVWNNLAEEGEKLKLIKIYVIHSKVPNTFPFQNSETQMIINSFSKFTEARKKKINSPTQKIF